MTRFERIDYTFEGSYAVGKMLPNSISCYREISPKIDVATFIVLALKIATTTSTTTLIRQQPSNPSSDSPPAKILSFAEDSDDG